VSAPLRIDSRPLPFEALLSLSIRSDLELPLLVAFVRGLGPFPNHGERLKFTPSLTFFFLEIIFKEIQPWFFPGPKDPEKSVPTAKELLSFFPPPFFKALRFFVYQFSFSLNHPFRACFFLVPHPVVESLFPRLRNGVPSPSFFQKVPFQPFQFFLKLLAPRKGRDRITPFPC